MSAERTLIVPQNMSPRLLLVATGVAVGLLLLPPILFVIPPYAASLLYTHTAPLSSSHPHVQAAAASIHDHVIALLCVFPVAQWSPLSPCHGHRSAAYPASAMPACTEFSRFIDSHRVHFDIISEHVASMASSVALLNSIIDDVDLVLAYDGHVMLVEDGALELQGVGDVQLLLNIARESRALGERLYELFLHTQVAHPTSQSSKHQSSL